MTQANEAKEMVGFMIMTVMTMMLVLLGEKQEIRGRILPFLCFSLLLMFRFFVWKRIASMMMITDVPKEKPVISLSWFRKKERGASDVSFRWVLTMTAGFKGKRLKRWSSWWYYDDRILFLFFFFAYTIIMHTTGKRRFSLPPSSFRFLKPSFRFRESSLLPSHLPSHFLPGEFDSVSISKRGIYEEEMRISNTSCSCFPLLVFSKISKLEVKPKDRI